jgi:hypothetical protein
MGCGCQRCFDVWRNLARPGLRGIRPSGILTCHLSLVSGRPASALILYASERQRLLQHGKRVHRDRSRPRVVPGSERDFETRRKSLNIGRGPGGDSEQIARIQGACPSRCTSPTGSASRRRSGATSTSPTVAACASASLAAVKNRADAYRIRGPELYRQPREALPSSSPCRTRSRDERALTSSCPVRHRRICRARTED